MLSNGGIQIPSVILIFGSRTKPFALWILRGEKGTRSDMRFGGRKYSGNHPWRTVQINSTHLWGRRYSICEVKLERSSRRILILINGCWEKFTRLRIAQNDHLVHCMYDPMSALWVDQTKKIRLLFLYDILNPFNPNCQISQWQEILHEHSAPSCKHWKAEAEKMCSRLQALPYPLYLQCASKQFGLKNHRILGSRLKQGQHQKIIWTAFALNQFTSFSDSMT